jgi:hypothetical protein
MALSTQRSRRKVRTGTKGGATRASVALPTGERYSSVRKAEFLLNNAATEAEYKVARREAKALGVDPDTVPHVPPHAR